MKSFIFGFLLFSAGVASAQFPGDLSDQVGQLERENLRLERENRHYESGLRQPLFPLHSDPC